MSGFLTVLAFSMINNLGYKNELIIREKQEQKSTWPKSIVGILGLQNKWSISQWNSNYN